MIPPKKTSSEPKLKFEKISARKTGHRIVAYGPGGIGKTSLCAALPGPVAFYDLDESLDKLLPNLGDHAGNIVRAPGGESWQKMLDTLKSDGWDGIGSIVLDTGTVAEEMLVEHILATVRNDNGQKVDRLEDYGWGKHVRLIYESFLPLLDTLDTHAAAGRHVVIIAHDCTNTVPNPDGNDFIRYEPRLFAGNKKGENSLRSKVKEWSDHTLFIGYDVNVATDKKGAGNKAKGSGTRTLYTAELPHFMAKSRTTSETIPVGDNAAEVWSRIIK